MPHLCLVRRLRAHSGMNQSITAAIQTKRPSFACAILAWLLPALVFIAGFEIVQWRYAENDDRAFDFIHATIFFAAFAPIPCSIASFIRHERFFLLSLPPSVLAALFVIVSTLRHRFP